MQKNQQKKLNKLNKLKKPLEAVFLVADVCLYSYWDKRWKSSFMFYVEFISGSKDFLGWIETELKTKIEISGHTTSSRKKNIYYQLKYSKYDGIKLVRRMYG